MPTVFSDETNGFQFSPEPPMAEMSCREGQESTAVTSHGHVTNQRKAQLKRQVPKHAEVCHWCHSFHTDPSSGT